MTVPTAFADAKRARLVKLGTVLAILAIAAALRLAALFTVGDNPTLRGDETYYIKQAASLANGDGYPGAMRPPGFAAFLAASSALFGGELFHLRVAQLLGSLVAVAIVFDLVARRFSPKAAAISALALAVSPDHVHFAHLLWAESFQTTLLLGTLWLLERCTRRDDVGTAVLAGLAAAAAAMTREISLYLVPLFALWLRHEDGGRSRRALLFVGVVAVCIAPWAIRNTLHFGELVLISTNRWYPIAEGNLVTMDTPNQRIRELRRAYYDNPDELAREHDARTVALSAIWEQQPWWIAKKIPVNLYFLLAPTRSQLHRFADEGWLPERWAGAADWLVPIEAVVFGVVLILGIAGVWLVPDPTLKRLVVLVFAVFVAIYVVGNAASRFRVPLLPLLMLYVGPLLTGVVGDGRWRRIGAAVCIVGWLVIAGVDVFARPRMQYAAIAPAAPAWSSAQRSAQHDPAA
jgi:4-amino-4-deoxy-L-arabinose transferase-like glycosyltransferase